MASLANLIDSVDFWEKLIDDCVVDTGATRLWTSGLKKRQKWKVWETGTWKKQATL